MKELKLFGKGLVFLFTLVSVIAAIVVVGAGIQTLVLAQGWNAVYVLGSLGFVWLAYLIGKIN